MYCDTYIARGNDAGELQALAKARGFSNPGPIVAFPPNNSIFPRNASPGAFKPGTQVLVPWRQDLLQKLIATMQHLAAEVAADAREIIESNRKSKEQLEQFLLMIDALCMLANIGKGVADLIGHGLKHGEMTSAQMISWFLNSRLEMANDIATLAIPAPAEPKRDFKFYVRHTLGPWTPSFWVAVAAAVKTGDVNIYLYGPAAIEYQTKMKIKTQADADIKRLQAKIQVAQRQLGMPFYNARI
jgi:hypothetical protein